VVTNRRDGHPTREMLISTVMRLLEAKHPDDLKVEEILAESGVSSGSLYHHFGSLRDLVDQTIIAQCAEITDFNIAALAKLTSAATDKQSLSALLRTYLYSVVGPSQRAERAVRTKALARATSDERFRQLLAKENARVTDVVANFIRGLQARGIVKPGVSAMAVATFAMAYTIGLVVNDLAEEPVEVEDMVSLIAGFYDHVIYAE
jgi:AcrR family transcriptional regulator